MRVIAPATTGVLEIVRSAGAGSFEFGLRDEPGAQRLWHDMRLTDESVWQIELHGLADSFAMKFATTTLAGASPVRSNRTRLTVRSFGAAP